MSERRFLQIPHDELSLEHTLGCGQSFRWSLSSTGWWTGVVRGGVIRIRRADRGFEWETYPTPGDLDLVRGYFRLDDNIPRIYSRLASADERLPDLIRRFRGMRLLRQDPEEALLSFVCSAANSIPRIARSIESMAAAYGSYTCILEDVCYYEFPSLDAILKAEHSGFRTTTGLGFRVSALKRVAEQLLLRPDGWLRSLRDASYADARTELMSIDGIGPKIADCVCLFALDKDEAVPVDTHIRQIAERLYMPELRGRSLTKTVHDEISRVFSKKFGEYAGWAQQFLFYDDVLRGRPR